MSELNIKIGMFTPGLSLYWPQMPGIEEEIEGYAKEVEHRLSEYTQVLNFGIVDNIQYARQVEEKLIQNDVDIVVIHAGTYGISKNVIPCIRRVGAHILTLHLQPAEAFHEKSSSEVTIPKNAFSISGEMGAALNRCGKRFVPIAGRLRGDKQPWREIESWCRAVSVKKKLRSANLALIGNFYPGMSDLYADFTELIRNFGVNIELLEIADLRIQIDSVTEQEVKENYQKTRSLFTIDLKASEKKLAWCNRVAVAMKKLTEKHELHGLAYHHSGYSGSEEERIAYSMTLGGSFLTAIGIPCAAEGDIVITIPMLILKALGAGASQTEINVADFEDEIIYFSHSGPGDLSISQEKPFLRWLDFFHGRRGSGVSCQFSLRQGPVTFLSLTKGGDGRYRFIATEGEAVSGKHLENGNVNTRVKVSPNITSFIERWTRQGPTHHGAIGIGHHLGEIEKVARVLDIEFITV